MCCSLTGANFPDIEMRKAISNSVGNEDLNANKEDAKMLKKKKKREV